MLPLSRRRFLRAGAGLSLMAGAAPVFSAEPPPDPSPAPGKEEKKDPYADAVLVKGEPPLPEEGSFTLVALPDTQHYCDKYPELFLAQTRWIAEQRESRHIAGVLHLGDITNNNTPEQWENAVKAMKVLDDRVPCFMAPGNHDYGPKGNGSVRESSFTRYFPPDTFRSRRTFGGFYDREPDRVENSYHLFSAGGRDFLVLCLEFGPRKDVVRWANEVVAKHAAREAILVTHAFTYYDDARYDWKQFGEKQRWNPHDYGMAKSGGDDVSDGEELWQNLICRHKNFIFTINGHVLEDGLGRLTSETPDGRAVHQMLVNFQMRPQGGDGWLRLLEFRKDGSLLAMDYSPVRGERNESPQNRFDLKLTARGS
jgi:hypothetical protein